MREFDILLSYSPHEHGLDRSYICTHVVSVKTKACLKPETVSGPQTRRDELRIREESVAEALCILWSYRYLEAVLSYSVR